jgi:hypothetical protein
MTLEEAREAAREASAPPGTYVWVIARTRSPEDPDSPSNYAVLSHEALVSFIRSALGLAVEAVERWQFGEPLP